MGVNGYFAREFPMASKNIRGALVLVTFYALLYLLVWVPNHLLFRTYALDLGLYTHALWSYSHGHLADSALFQAVPQPLLADHFDLYLPVLSPLVFVFGTWTLQLVQWAALLVGAWGLRAFLLAIGVRPAPATAAMAMMLSFFGMFAAVAFDYHSNAVGAMLFPWVLLALVRQRPWHAAFLFAALLAAKENMGLWAGPAALLLWRAPWLHTGMQRTAVVLGILGLAWPLVIIGEVMPALSMGNNYDHFDYAVLGGHLRNAPLAVLRHPVNVLSALFVDHVGVKDGTAMKLEFWWMLLAAGGWAFFACPRWGLMAIPLLLQKMLNDDPWKWGVSAQYGVEFAPLVGVAVGLAFSRLRGGQPPAWVLLIAAGASMGVLVRFMDSTATFQDRSRIRFYQESHYTTGLDWRAARSVVSSLPREASVSAQSPAVPQLALRDSLYQFPIIGHARFILLLPGESPYPLDPTAYRHRRDSLLDAPAWEVQVNTPSLILFKRRQAD